VISVTATYALRALTELAILPGGGMLLGKELSKRAGIPPNYLSKILWSLGGSGLIEATRGIRGGYRLSRPPEEIPLLEVVALFDKTRSREGCFLFGDQPCSDREPCSAHEAWREVGAAYARFLESTTLADISRRKQVKKRRKRPD
jgi:Rrf2 family protein